MDLANLEATSATLAIQRGEILAEAYAAALVSQCRRFASLNAFLTIDEEKVLSAARGLDKARRKGEKPGALQGLLLAIKDNIDVDGFATSCNMRQLSQPPASADAIIVRMLRNAGSLILGKTTMPELCLFGATEGARIPVNPYAADYMTGGSSSGSAVAVSARMAPVGLGTDTGGSIRIPAAHCGLAGLRPSLGRYPSDGIVVLCPTRDTAGVMTRTVRDLALLDAAIVQCETRFSPLRLDEIRLGVPPSYFNEDLDPETAEFASRELRLLRDAGAELVEADVEGIADLNDKISLPVYLHELKERLSAHLDRRLPGVSLAGFVKEISSPGGRLLIQGLLGSAEGLFPAPTPEEYDAAITVYRPALREAYRNYFNINNVDAIVYPTTPLPARPISESGGIMLNGWMRDSLLIYVRSIDPSSNAGLPGVTVPGGLTAAGVPLGLAFDGPDRSDRRLLAIAAAYEALRPMLPPPAIASRHAGMVGQAPSPL
jgi:mandelamide amidase